MTKLTTITDGDLSATIDAQGAQLMSVKLGDGEYLWQGDERYWARRAPVLCMNCQVKVLSSAATANPCR